MSYTEDWFTNNISVWNKVLGKLRNKPLKFIEIGCFEGRSSVWLLENILTHKESKLVCIDHWLHHNDKNKNVYKTFLSNIEPWKNKVVVMKGYSREVLRDIKDRDYDFVYIDASKHSRDVLEDAVLGWDLLKKGGLLIFDDYTHNKEHDNNCPRPGIDAFLNIYKEELDILHTKWQVIIKKNNKKSLHRPCYSEKYNEPKETPTIFKNINK